MRTYKKLNTMFLASTLFATTLFAASTHTALALAAPLNENTWENKIEQEHKKYLKKKGNSIRIESSSTNSDDEKIEITTIKNKNGSSSITANRNGEVFYQQRCVKKNICYTLTIFTGDKWVKTKPKKSPLKLRKLDSFFLDEYKPTQNAINHEYYKNKNTKTFSYEVLLSSDQQELPGTVEIIYDKNLLIITTAEPDGISGITYEIDIDAEPTKIRKPPKNTIAESTPPFPLP